MRRAVRKASGPCFRCKITDSGLDTYCKPCHAVIQQEHRDKDRVTYRKKENARRKLNPEARRLSKNKARFKNYGLTQEEFELIRDFQGSKCAICKRFMARPNIDHCHKTGITRGLLCWRCNGAIGKFQDDPVLLRTAAFYLLNHPVELCLGRKVYGLPGRVTTSLARRKMLARKSGLPLEVYAAF